MESNIQYIKVYNNGLIEMIVICNSCKIQNTHTITHASTKTNDKITINFSKLGKRCCDNFGHLGNLNTMCGIEYNLYK